MQGIALLSWTSPNHPNHQQLVQQPSKSVPRGRGSRAPSPTTTPSSPSHSRSHPVWDPRSSSVEFNHPSSSKSHVVDCKGLIQCAESVECTECGERSSCPAVRLYEFIKEDVHSRHEASSPEALSHEFMHT